MSHHEFPTSLQRSAAHSLAQELGYDEEPEDCWQCGELGGMYSSVSDDQDGNLVEAWICGTCGYAHCSNNYVSREDELKKAQEETLEIIEELPSTDLEMLEYALAREEKDSVGAGTTEAPPTIAESAKSYGYRVVTPAYQPEREDYYESWWDRHSKESSGSGTGSGSSYSGGGSGSSSSPYTYYSSSSYYSSTPYVPPRITGYYRKPSKAVLEGLSNNEKFPDDAFVVYNALFQDGPMTAAELKKSIAESEDADVAPSVDRQLKKMLRMGLTQKVGRGACKVSGEESLIWDVTDHGITERVQVARRVRQTLAVGPSLEEAARTFCNAVGWIVTTVEVTDPADPLTARVTCTDGQTFMATGVKVPGGVVLTEWV